MSYAFIHTIRFIILSITLFCAFALSPKVHAYFTTAQKTISLDGDSTLFLIEYVFGNEKHDIYMPIIANATSTTSDTALSYEITDRTGNPAKGKVSGVALGDASIRNGMYFIPKGIAKRFILAVVFTPESYNETPHRLHVTHLPFNFDGNYRLRLNPSELTYYAVTNE